MTDYLELYRQSGADALWEAIARLAQPLPMPKAGREGTEADYLVGNGRKTARLEQMEEYSQQGEGGVWLTREAEYTAGKKRAENERIRGLQNPEQGLGYAAETENVKSGGGRAGQPVWEMGQAEHLDRIFQRDSRRYDGGFFLY